MDRLWLGLGAVVGFLSVALGAMGAHALEAKVAAGTMTPKLLDRFETGVRYAAIHGLALILIAALSGRFPARPLNVAGGAFGAGVLLFSGSLIVYALTGFKKLGMITPFGGLAFLIGWAALVWAAVQKSPA
jgi:uncharacterized membrane protein YgdD (TMEM256/DUF423 family)